jgi:hypothetical protein
MAVTIRPKFNAAQIAKFLAGKRIAIYNAIVSRLKFVGESFVTKARNSDTYKDQTGNLRSSIGYVIYYNGQHLESDFPGAQSEGVTKARELADEVAADFPHGFVLICVAGMDYASAVEARGYDVITNSSLEAIDDLRQAMREIKDKINRTP